MRGSRSQALLCKISNKDSFDKSYYSTFEHGIQELFCGFYRFEVELFHKSLAVLSSFFLSASFGRVPTASVRSKSDRGKRAGMPNRPGCENHSPVQTVEKLTVQNLPVLMIKGLGSSPFSKGLADSKGRAVGRPSQWMKSPLRSALGRG